MRKILVFARNGQLGFELRRTLAPLGEVVALDFPEVDFTRPDGLRALVETVAPDIIVNPAAYTNVDKAESESTIARLVNCDSVRVLAEEAARCGIPLIHFSTDYVYDGSKGAAYRETDPTHPLNVYGQTKLEGDQAIMASGAAAVILRTSWVYSTRQGGFVTKVLQWARQQETLRVVDDQISSPTSARGLAEATALLLAKAGEHPLGWFAEKAGVYHCTGGGSCSRYEWAKEIIALDPHKDEQAVRELLPAKSSEFAVPANRPLVSVLNSDKLEKVFGLRLPDWKQELKLVMEG